MEFMQESLAYVYDALHGHVLLAVPLGGGDVVEGRWLAAVFLLFRGLPVLLLPFFPVVIIFAAAASPLCVCASVYADNEY